MPVPAGSFCRCFWLFFIISGLLKVINLGCVSFFSCPLKYLPIMHILHIITGRELCDQAQQAIRLIEGLARYNISSTLICRPGSVVAIAAQARGLKVIVAPDTGYFGLRWVFALRRIIKEINPAIVHVHCRRGVGRLSGFAAVLAGTKSIVSRGMAGGDNLLLGRVNYWFHSRVLASSTFLAEQFISNGLPESKLRMVRSGVDPAVCQPSWSPEKFQREFGLQPNQFVIGVVADFYSHQGHRYLLEALPQIRAAYAGVRVIFIGEGPLEERIKKRIKAQGLESNVQFAGSRTDLLDFLGHFQLLIHPAICEELPLRLLEAQAAGVPVVGFNIDGVKDVVAASDIGNLAGLRDSGEMAAVVQRLMYRPKDRTRLSQITRQWIDAEFSIDDMVASNLVVYEEMTSTDAIASRNAWELSR
jgi:glycosyltransferase involved in cell wall biosynthesis